MLQTTPVVARLRTAAKTPLLATFVGQAPPAIGSIALGQRVRDRVEIGRDGEAVQDSVVSGVDDADRLGRIHDPCKRGEKAAAPTTAEDGDHELSPARRRYSVTSSVAQRSQENDASCVVAAASESARTVVECGGGELVASRSHQSARQARCAAHSGMLPRLLARSARRLASHRAEESRTPRRGDG